jgi:hypothetical protein
MPQWETVVKRIGPSAHLSKEIGKILSKQLKSLSGKELLEAIGIRKENQATVMRHVIDVMKREDTQDVALQQEASWIDPGWVAEAFSSSFLARERWHQYELSQLKSRIDGLTEELAHLHFVLDSIQKSELEALRTIVFAGVQTRCSDPVMPHFLPLRIEIDGDISRSDGENVVALIERIALEFDLRPCFRHAGREGSWYQTVWVETKKALSPSKFSMSALTLLFVLRCQSNIKIDVDDRILQAADSFIAMQIHQSMIMSHAKLVGELTKKLPPGVNVRLCMDGVCLSRLLSEAEGTTLSLEVDKSLQNFGNEATQNSKSQNSRPAVISDFNESHVVDPEVSQATTKKSRRKK